MVISDDACPVRPRESVQVALTLTGPGAKPAVLSVAELPVPVTVPAVDVQLATDTGALSGLVQLAERLTVPPGTSSFGLAEIDMVGGFFGGSDLMV